MVSPGVVEAVRAEDHNDLLSPRERQHADIVLTDGGAVRNAEEPGTHVGTTTDKPLIYLASKSPRRRQLLGEAEIDFEHIDAGVDDGTLDPGPTDPHDWVASLAYLKASAAYAQFQRAPGSTPGLILGADTVVVKQDDIIGQPRDARHAAAIIRRLRDGSHVVVTGVALVDPETGERDLFIDAAVVTVGPIPNPEIEAYVGSGDWRGKAGAYNLQERIDAGWPLSCEGDPTTVMGLPMLRLPDRLVQFWRRCRADTTPNAAR